MNCTGLRFEMHEPVLDHVWRKGRKLLLTAAKCSVRFPDGSIIIWATYGHPARKRS